MNQFRDVGHVNRGNSTGRPRITTPQQDREIVEYLKDNPFSTATRSAALQGVPYVTATRRIRESDIRNYAAARETGLTQLHRDARIRFARYMLNELTEANFERIIFTDEKTFRTDENHHAHVYRPRGERFTERYVVKDRLSGRVSASYWAWISCAGPGEIVATGRNFNSQEYMRVLDEVALPSIEAQFGNLDHIIFQQDNAAIHKARIVLQYLEEKNVRLLDWPANSPDLSLIELVWAKLENTRSPLIQRDQNGLNAYVLNKWESLRAEPG